LIRRLPPLPLLPLLLLQLYVKLTGWQGLSGLFLNALLELPQHPDLPQLLRTQLVPQDP
jgi:hypothetical protein